MRVRIKMGAPIIHNRHNYNWPDHMVDSRLSPVDANMFFESVKIQENDQAGYLTLMAFGFGFQEPSGFGNGPIMVKKENVEIIEE